MNRFRRALAQELRNQVFVRDKAICEYCSQPVPHDFFNVDHVVPYSKGGTDSVDNLVLCCIDCNSKKRARMLPAKQLNTILAKIKERNSKTVNQSIPMIMISSRKRPAKQFLEENNRHNELMTKAAQIGDEAYISIAQLKEATICLNIKALATFANLNCAILRRKIQSGKELDLNESVLLADALLKHGVSLLPYPPLLQKAD